MQKTPQVELVSLEKKLEDVDLMASLRSMDKKELEFKLLELSKHREEIATTKQNDEQLQEVKEELKTLNAPYVEQLKINKLKIRIIHLLIKEKGE